MKKLNQEIIVSGRVIAGKHLGRQLGFPTANLNLTPPPQLKPGVYLAVCQLNKNFYLGLAYYKQLLEVYIFNFNQEIYGRKLSVKLTHFLRSPKKVSHRQALKKLIQNDLVSLDNYIILVNRQDQPLGILEKKSAHLGSGRLHRAISVQLFNSNQELLIQQRSKAKMLFPLTWANTVCTDVRPYESYQSAAIRRLKEEMGLELDLKPAAKFYYQARYQPIGAEKEIDQLFIGFTDRRPKPNPLEIHAFKFLSLSQLKTQLKLHSAQFAPWFKIILKKLS